MKESRGIWSIKNQWKMTKYLNFVMYVSISYLLILLLITPVPASLKRWSNNKKNCFYFNSFRAEKELCMWDICGYNLTSPTQSNIFIFFSFLKVLKDWVNDVLADTRVVVKSIEEDFNDGQVLAMLLGKTTGIKFKIWSSLYDQHYMIAQWQII